MANTSTVSPCIFDDTSQQYVLMTVGWQRGERVSGPTLYLRLKHGKIWIEDDWTDQAIATDLMEAGVPPEDIVLGFQPPTLRSTAELALA